jgi:regulatory protein
MGTTARTAGTTGRKPPRAPAAAPPDSAALREAALAHLARYAATRAGLLRVLNRRIDRWARAAGDRQEDGGRITAAAAAARQDARTVVDRLVETGVVNDAAFAAQRAQSLTRSGRSRRAIAAHLAARGIPMDAARDALPEDAEAELGAALALARRRRIGPFRPNLSDAGDADAETRRRELSVLARAGFPESVARQALTMDAEEAEARVIQLKRS